MIAADPTAIWTHDEAAAAKTDMSAVLGPETAGKLSTALAVIAPLGSVQRIAKQRVLGSSGKITLFFRQEIHTRAHREIVGILGAAVEHHNQWTLAASYMARYVDLIVPRACRAAKGFG